MKYTAISLRNDDIMSSFRKEIAVDFISDPIELLLNRYCEGVERILDWKTKARPGP